MPHSPTAFSSRPADDMLTTTCYMCACRCGIRVHLKQGEIRYIDGNPAHPVNRGVICGKGASGIMKQLSPAKLRKPLLRVGERGEGRFREIEWDEALDIATRWLRDIRRRDPKQLAFFTGRDQSQALTGWWAQQFGTPNYAAHGGFCSVAMAAAGLYSIGGSFWEFGEPDFDRAKLFVMFGVAEDHASNPIKLGIAELKRRGARFISINPVRTGYSAVADHWIAIRPGTDGLLVGALIHELLSAGRTDEAWLAEATNAAWLVVQDPGAADHGLFARDGNGQPLVATTQGLQPWRIADLPKLAGAVSLPDGRKAVPVLHLLAERFLAPVWRPEAVAERCGISAGTIRALARELADTAFDQDGYIASPWTDWRGRKHDGFVARPVSFHAMRGIAAHANGFHTCRLIHLLQMLLGAVDRPGSFRYKPPFPKPIPPPERPGREAGPDSPLTGGPPLGFPAGPDDLLVDETGHALRIDKAFSWEAPLAIHGAMHLVVRNAWAGDPYPIDTLFLFMANLAWNSSMNVPEVARMLSDRDPKSGEYRIPRIIYADAFWSETTAFADLVLPDTTYLERHDCISLLDRPISTADGPADAIRQPVIQPDRDVRPFQSVLLDLGSRLGLPGMVDGEGRALYPDGFPQYMAEHERKPGIGLLAGWRGPQGRQAGRGPANPNQLQHYVDNGCFWHQRLAEGQLFQRNVNADYLSWAAEMGFVETTDPVILQLYCEPLQRFRLAAEGHGAHRPPPELAARVTQYCDPMPFWYPATESEMADSGDYPYAAVTQRPMIMYHSWDSQNAWQRQILSANRLYVARETARDLGLQDDDWVWIISRHGRVKGQIRLMEGCERGTVWTWNAVAKRPGAWGLSEDAPEVTSGFLLNHLIHELLPTDENGRQPANADPVTGQAAWYDLRVRLQRCEDSGVAEAEPRLAAQAAAPGAPESPGALDWGRQFRAKEPQT